MTISRDGLTFELLETPHNWAFSAEISSAWQRSIATALRGDEDRANLRPLPKAEFEWTISPADNETWAGLEDQLDTALRSGRAASPLWPRPSPILSRAGAVLVLDPAGIVWTVGMQLWCGVVRTVAGYNSGVLTLDAAPPAGSAEVYPIFFGRLTVEKDELQSDVCANVTLRLTQAQFLSYQTGDRGAINPLSLLALTVWTGSAVETKSFWVSEVEPVNGLELPLTDDGVLQAQTIWLFTEAAGSPASGAVLFDFYANGVARRAYIAP